MGLLSGIKKKFRKQHDDIIIVSGLPRSGTSVMMRALEKGGINLLTDNLRTADDDNPRGYYELEIAKKLPKGEFEWLKEAEGKAVKIISELLKYLPPTYSYKVIFMHRNMEEILASQKKMLINRNENTLKVDDKKMAGMFTKHLRQIDEWVNSQDNFKRIEINYNKMMENPLPWFEQTAFFLGAALDVQKMKGVVDSRLYRQRKG